MTVPCVRQSHSSDGSGYYRPTEEEVAELDHFIAQEEGRLKSIGWSLMGARKLRREFKNKVG